MSFTVAACGAIILLKEGLKAGTWSKRYERIGHKSLAQARAPLGQGKDHVLTII